MRVPTRTMSGNLRWTRSGTVWADWLLTPRPYGLRPAKEKSQARDLHSALFRALPGESLLLGLVSGQDPAAVVERMLSGVDLEDSPEWVTECTATLDTLDELGPSQRLFWLSVPLGVERASDRGLEPLRSKYSDLLDRLGLPRPRVDSDDVERRLRQAARVAETIPAPFHAAPATPAQMVWLHGHQLQRGLFLDLNLPGGDGTDLAGELLTRSSSALTEPVLDEGGLSDFEGKSAQASARQAFHRRRYVKVSPGDVADAAASYQALSVISDVPDEGIVFPGAELLGRIDQSGLPVEWAMRLTVRSGNEVASSNRRALRNLNDQYVQQDPSKSANGLTDIDRAAEALGEFSSILQSDKLEVETQATVIFCLAGVDPEVLRQQQNYLREFIASAGYKLAQPIGYQIPLWWAMQPGVASTRHVREFAQTTVSGSLSALVPLASTELGDAKGSLVGLNISNGPLLSPHTTSGVSDVVLHDLEGASDRHTSGSVAIAGEPGGGKSVFIKKMVGDVIHRGGRAIIIDHTQVGEYALWARHMTRTVVVDIDNPQLSLDPLRLFGPEAGARIAQSFLTPLLNVHPTSDRGVLLSEVLDPDYLADHNLTSLGDLVEHLDSAEQLSPAAKDMARVIKVFSRKDIGRIIFDPTVPALDLSAKAVVIRTHSLQLPSPDDLTHAHLFDQLPLEKILGRALYSLLSSLARHVCFRDRNELGVFALDESHSVTVSPECEREIVEFVRDGRKHRALVILGSQDAEADFGSSTLRGLIPTRILTRQRDKGLAASGLSWLGLDPDDELVELVTRDTSPLPTGGETPLWRRGEGLMRDSSSNIGRIKILLPASEEHRDAALSTPDALVGHKETS